MDTIRADPGASLRIHAIISQVKKTMQSNNLPLAGIKVVDLSRVLAGPFCAMLLSYLGA